MVMRLTKKRIGQKKSDRRVKKILEAILGTELSPWFQKLYL
jgi:hypothetical protein